MKPKVLRHLSPVTLAAAIVVFSVIAGFVRFSEKVSHLTAPPTLPIADGIIVLTGGASRIETGLLLLDKRLGKRLLISGVNQDTNEDSLMRATHTQRQTFDCCVDLGRHAKSTIGNAEESAAWVNTNKFRSVYIVTNDYHMPRSLLELSKALPDVQLIAFPVPERGNSGHSNWQNYNRLKTLAAEYIKYIGALVRYYLL